MDDSSEQSKLTSSDFVFATKEAERKKWIEREEQVAGTWTYEMRLGRTVIRLGVVEYRILEFLAAKPYHAFTPAQIVAAVDSKDDPVTEETLTEFVRRLRNQLGLFSDYIQSVPRIGYRFKA